MSLIPAACITHSLQSGVDVINGVDSQKFPLVLNRVAQGLLNKSDELKPFSEDEEEKLCATLSVSLSELRLMLDCSFLILKQAAFNITKPAVLQQQLAELKLNEDKTEAFVSTWTAQAKNIVGALKNKSIHPHQVEGVGWLLNTTVSSSDAEAVLEPRAIIQLKTPADNVCLDLDQSQLRLLYDTLETIQARLDNIR